MRVAEAEMLGALRVITVERGIDPRRFALMPFGGAGPLHACAMARELGIAPRALPARLRRALRARARRRRAAPRRLAHRHAARPSSSTRERLRELRDGLIAEADAALAGERAARMRVRLRAALPRPVLRAGRRAVARRPIPRELREAFAAAHEQRYGYRDDAAERRAGQRARVRLGARAGAEPARRRRGRAPSARRAQVVFDGQALDASRAARRARRPARACPGPAVCALAESTLLVPPGWSGAVDEHGTVHAAGRRPPDGRMSGLDPIELQVVAGALRAACEEMGVVLIRSAHSSNIKERRDASTALFDADGQMVMQAEHIPVHLGSMPAAVAAVLGERHAPGVSWILNDPFAGGTHLPDITVDHARLRDDGDAARLRRQPRASRRRRRARARLDARRQPHARRGGRRDRAARRSTRPRSRSSSRACASRSERRADLRAQLAANRIGALRLGALAERLGRERLRAATDAVLDYAERRTRACLAALPDGERARRGRARGAARATSCCACARPSTASG